MKLYPVIIIVIAILILSVGGRWMQMHRSKGSSSNQYISVTPEKAYQLIQENQCNSDFIIIDVRTPDEYRSGHIAGAINIDFYRSDFQKELRKLNQSKTYLVYCRSGNRSSQAMKEMEKMGFQKIYNMLQGINGWKRNGYPVV